MGGNEAVEAFRQDGVDGIDELFHGRPPEVFAAFSARSRKVSGFPGQDHAQLRTVTARQYGDAVHEIGDGAVERGVQLVIAKVRHADGQVPRPAETLRHGSLAGMRALIGREEPVALGGAKWQTVMIAGKREAGIGIE